MSNKILIHSCAWIIPIRILSQNDQLSIDVTHSEARRRSGTGDQECCPIGSDMSTVNPDQHNRLCRVSYMRQRGSMAWRMRAMVVQQQRVVGVLMAVQGEGQAARATVGRPVAA